MGWGSRPPGILTCPARLLRQQASIQQCAHFRRSSSNLLAASSASRVDKGEIGAVALGPGRSEGREKRVIASAGAGPGW